MSAEQLLQDIRQFIIAATRDDLAEAERVSLRFNHGGEIVEAIDALLGTPELMIIEGEFDPYTDPDTRAMLERAGIATHNYRR